MENNNPPVVTHSGLDHLTISFGIFDTCLESAPGHYIYHDLINKTPPTYHVPPQDPPYTHPLLVQPLHPFLIPDHHYLHHACKMLSSPSIPYKDNSTAASGPPANYNQNLIPAFPASLSLSYALSLFL